MTARVQLGFLVILAFGNVLLLDHYESFHSDFTDSSKQEIIFKRNYCDDCSSSINLPWHVMLHSVKRVLFPSASTTSSQDTTQHKIPTQGLLVISSNL